LKPRELRAIRSLLDLTQVAMAKRLGISEREYRRFETGERRIPVILEIAARCLAHHRAV
jgi:transcriptional regulator with XRE-family HTH domain